MNEPRLKNVFCPGIAAKPAAATATAPQNTPEISPEAPAIPGHQMAYWEWNNTGNPQHPHVVLCVHGLTRQGRDFDVLARELSQHARVICPDVAGRGHSDWLAEPQAYQVPYYAADMLALLAAVHADAPMETLDWVGTSMGGLIGMGVVGQPGLPLPVPVRRLVLNDVGPTLEWSALSRIGQYLGQPLRFDTEQQAADLLWMVSSSFGPHTPQQWLELSRPMLRPLPESAGGGLTLHYDPAIAEAFKSLTQEGALAAEEQLWQLYDQITARTLVLRGAESDLLTVATAQSMAERGPRAQVVEIAGVGHAPTLVAPDQVVLVRDFLWSASDKAAA